ncbi:MAG TPA: enoyl-CoA hydratase/isomerase family protein [Solimonas sp.]|nr:enoyl-CoA hydratase/isomerase family protein [Solimonas sp.]
MIKQHLCNSVAVLTLDHPPVNATSQAVRQGLLDAVRAALADARVTGIVIIGARDAFSAGGDVRELGDASRNAPSLRDVIERIESSEKPVVAALAGYALGGGLELALGCHARIGIAPLRVGLPEVTLGVIPGAGGTQRLPRIIGAEAALDVMTSGRHLPADEALRLGILDALVDAPLEDAAVQFVRSGAATGPATRRLAPPPPAFFAQFRAAHRAAWHGLLAPWKIVDAVESLYRLPRAQAAAVEREAYLQCQASPQRAALGHLFTVRRALRAQRDEDREAVIAARLRAAVSLSGEWTQAEVDALAAAGRVLLTDGSARSADEIDLVAVDRLNFPAFLGGPMFGAAHRLCVSPVPMP